MKQDVIDREAGAQRVVVGSTAVKQPELVKGWMEEVRRWKNCSFALDINIDENGTRKVAISVGMRKIQATLKRWLKIT